MIVTAKIEKVEDGKLVLKPDMDISRFVAQKRPRRVEVRLDDGRAISADQRRKIFAFPRICGGDPQCCGLPGLQLNFSPHTRG